MSRSFSGENMPLDLDAQRVFSISNAQLLTYLQDELLQAGRPPLLLPFFHPPFTLQFLRYAHGSTCFGLGGIY